MYYSFIFRYMGISPACMYVNVTCVCLRPKKATRGNWIPWEWSCETVASCHVSTWELNSGRTASGFNCWVITPAPHSLYFCILFIHLFIHSFIRPPPFIILFLWYLHSLIHFYRSSIRDSVWSELTCSVQLDSVTVFYTQRRASKSGCERWPTSF